LVQAAKEARLLLGGLLHLVGEEGCRSRLRLAKITEHPTGRASLLRVLLILLAE